MKANETKEEVESPVSEIKIRLDIFENQEDWVQLADFDQQNWDLNSCKNNLDQAIPLQKCHKVVKKNENKNAISTELNTSSYFPNYSDIQKSLQIVRKVFPETFTDQVIDDLFQNLMQKMSNPFKKIPSPIVKIKDFAKTMKDNAGQRLQRSKSINNAAMLVSRKKTNQTEFIQIFHPNIPPRKQKANQSSLLADFHWNNSKYEKHPMIQNPQKGIASRLDKIWSQQYEQLLLHLYKKGHQFSFIRDHFQQEYPQHHSNFSVNSLRGRFYKVIRQTIRKLHIFIDKIGREFFPMMIKLSYNIIQNIMYLQEGRNLRCLLVDLYFCDRLNKVLIDRIIEGIHQFMADTKNLSNSKKNAEFD